MKDQRTELQKADFNIQFALILIAIITIPLFVLPLLLQIAVGGYQIVQNLVVLGKYKRLDRTSQNQMKIYWIVVSAYALISVWMYNQAGGTPDEIIILWWVVFPWGIAIYNAIITRIRVYGAQVAQQQHQFLDNINF